MRLEISEEAEIELREAAQWYERQSPNLGADLLRVAIDAFTSIERHPRRYALHPRLRTKREVRRYLLSPFPYAVVYEVLGDKLRVIAVAHTHRHPTYWRKRLQ